MAAEAVTEAEQWWLLMGQPFSSFPQAQCWRPAFAWSARPHGLGHSDTVQAALTSREPLSLMPSCSVCNKQG